MLPLLGLTWLEMLIQGIDAIRKKSMVQTSYLVELIQEKLIPLADSDAIITKGIIAILIREEILASSCLGARGNSGFTIGSRRLEFGVYVSLNARHPKYSW